MSAQEVYRSAILNSMGIGAPHDLGASLVHLEQAAEGGHRGTGPQRGVKWLLSQWIRSR